VTLKATGGGEKETAFGSGRGEEEGKTGLADYARGNFQSSD